MSCFEYVRGGFLTLTVGGSDSEDKGDNDINPIPASNLEGKQKQVNTVKLH